MQEPPDFLINFSRISRFSANSLSAHEVVKFYGKARLAPARSVRKSATVTSALAVGVVRLAALATTSVRFKKSDTTSTLESNRNLLSGPNAPLDSLRVVRLTAPRRLTSYLGRIGGMDGSRPRDFRLCGSVNVYTFYRQSPFCTPSPLCTSRDVVHSPEFLLDLFV